MKVDLFLLLSYGLTLLNLPISLLMRETSAVVLSTMQVSTVGEGGNSARMPSSHPTQDGMSEFCVVKMLREAKIRHRIPYSSYLSIFQ